MADYRKSTQLSQEFRESSILEDKTYGRQIQKFCWLKKNKS